MCLAEGKTLGGLPSATVTLCQGLYCCLQYGTGDYGASEGVATRCHFGTCHVEPGCPTLPGFKGAVLPFFFILCGVAFCPECAGFVPLSGLSLEEQCGPRSPRASVSTVPWAASIPLSSGPAGSPRSLWGLPCFLPCHHTANEDSWPCRHSPTSIPTARQFSSHILPVWCKAFPPDIVYVVLFCN